LLCLFYSLRSFYAPCCCIFFNILCFPSLRYLFLHFQFIFPRLSSHLASHTKSFS
jgi:hypothetical protein